MRADQLLVVGEQKTDRHAGSGLAPSTATWSRQPRGMTGPASNVPPAAVTRLRRPARPFPNEDGPPDAVVADLDLVCREPDRAAGGVRMAGHVGEALADHPAEQLMVRGIDNVGRRSADPGRPPTPRAALDHGRARPPGSPRGSSTRRPAPRPSVWRERSSTSAISWAASLRIVLAEAPGKIGL